MGRDMTAAEQVIADGIMRRLHDDEANRPRTQQTEARLLGISDMGLCRNKARHMIIQTPFDDGYDSGGKWAAMLGRAIEDYVLDRVVDDRNGHLRDLEVEVTLPSGLRIKGHPDLVMPRQNMVLDIKTTNGLYYARKDGASLQQRMQRRLYTAACLQQGILDPERPAFCGNVWFDRSGREKDPWVEVEQYEEYMLHEVDGWLDDVNYAVLHGEEADRDMSYEWCEVACPFFGSCRGADDPSTGLVDDPQGLLDAAAADYRRGRALINDGTAMQEAAKERLEGVNGTLAHHTVKHTWINEVDMPAVTRKGYFRTTVRERKG